MGFGFWPCGCCGNCDFCTDQPPDRVKLEIDNVNTVAGSPNPFLQCVNCFGLNGIYFLDPISPPDSSTQCLYGFNLSPVFSCDSANGKHLDNWQTVTFQFLSDGLGGFRFLAALSGSLYFIQWKADFPTKPKCNFGSGLNLPFFQQSNGCDGTGTGGRPVSTCVATAIYL